MNSFLLINSSEFSEVMLLNRKLYYCKSTTQFQFCNQYFIRLWEIKTLKPFRFKIEISSLISLLIHIQLMIHKLLFHLILSPNISTYIHIFYYFNILNLFTEIFCIFYIWTFVSFYLVWIFPYHCFIFENVKTLEPLIILNWFFFFKHFQIWWVIFFFWLKYFVVLCTSWT